MNNLESMQTLSYLDKCKGINTVAIKPQTHTSTNISRSSSPDITSRPNCIFLVITQAPQTALAYVVGTTKPISELTGEYI